LFHKKAGNFIDIDKTNDDNQLFSNAQVIKILESNNSVAQKSVINLLDSNLPFSVKSISDPFLVKNRLSYFLWLLKNFRNEYAHYHERELDSRTTLDREEDFKKRFLTVYKTVGKKALKQLFRIGGFISAEHTFYRG
jgi:hypothetical protein